MVPSTKNKLLKRRKLQCLLSILYHVFLRSSSRDCGALDLGFDFSAGENAKKIIAHTIFIFSL